MRRKNSINSLEKSRQISIKNDQNKKFVSQKSYEILNNKFLKEFEAVLFEV